MTKQELITTFKILFAVFCTLLFIFLGLYIWNFGWGFSSLSSDWANFGSYLNGSLGTSLSGFATIILLLTLVLQIRQFDNTREVLSLTQKQLDSANKTADIERFENTFFHLLTSYSGMINSFSYHEHTGRKALSTLHDIAFNYLTIFHDALGAQTITEYLKTNNAELNLLKMAGPETLLPETKFRATFRAFRALWALRELFFANRQIASLPLSIVDLLLRKKTSIDYGYYLSIFTAQMSITERRLLIATFSCFKSAKAYNGSAEESFLELIPLTDDRALFNECTKYFNEIAENQEIILAIDPQ